MYDELSAVREERRTERTEEFKVERYEAQLDLYEEARNIVDAHDKVSFDLLNVSSDYTLQSAKAILLGSNGRTEVAQEASESARSLRDNEFKAELRIDDFLRRVKRHFGDEVEDGIKGFAREAFNPEIELTTNGWFRDWLVERGRIGQDIDSLFQYGARKLRQAAFFCQNPDTSAVINFYS